MQRRNGPAANRCRRRRDEYQIRSLCPRADGVRPSPPPPRYTSVHVHVRALQLPERSVSTRKQTRRYSGEKRQTRSTKLLRLALRGRRRVRRVRRGGGGGGRGYDARYGERTGKNGKPESGSSAGFREYWHIRNLLSEPVCRKSLIFPGSIRRFPLSLPFTNHPYVGRRVRGETG